MKLDLNAKVRDTLSFLAKVMCLLVVTFIFFSALKSLFRGTRIVVVLIFLGAPGAVIGVEKIYKYLLQKNDKLVYVQICMHIMSLMLMLLIAYYGNVEYTWDWGTLLRTATSLVLKGENIATTYYLRYPNNQFWLAVLTFFFKALKTVKQNITPLELKTCSMILSICFVRITYIFMFFSCKEMFGLKKARIFDIFFVMCLPLHIYSYFAYTDTAALLCVSVLIYLFLRLKGYSYKNIKKTLCLIMFSFFVALIIRIKIMSFIIFCGMFISELLDRKIEIKQFVIKYMVIFIFVSLFGALLGNVVRTELIKVDFTQAEKYEFPPVHWIMMGMNAHGGYEQADVDYAIGFKDYDERNKMETKELIKRINDRGISGTIKHVFDTKATRTWGNSLLFADRYISVKPVHPDSLIERIFGTQGEYHWICLVFSWQYYLLLLIGCVLSAIGSISKHHTVDFMQLSIIGIFFFLSIWECNSRYLLTFVPVLYLCALNGWIEMNKSKKELKH